MGMGCQHSMTGALRDLVHIIFMFPHPNNRGYTNLGCQGAWVKWDRPMLEFSGVGSSRGGSCHEAQILGTWNAPLSPFSMLKRVKLLSSSLAVGVLMHILPFLMFPTFLHLPSTLSFPNISPLGHPMALQQSITRSTLVVVAIILLIIVIMAICIFSSPFCAQMMANVDSPDAVYTLVVYRRCVQQ